MTENKKKKGDLLFRFLPYYKKYKGILILDLLCASLTTVVEIVLPLIAREITGRAEADVTSLTPRFILTCGVIYLILRLIDTAAYYYMASTGHVMGTKIETDMRRDFFTHLQKLSFSYLSLLNNRNKSSFKITCSCFYLQFLCCSNSEKSATFHNSYAVRERFGFFHIMCG